MKGLPIGSLASAEIDRLVRDMDEQGYARLAGVFPEESIARARQWVLRELERHGGEYFSYIGRDAVKGSLIAEIGGSPGLRAIMAQIYERGLRRPPPETGVFQVLRVLSGATGLRQAYQFHYDAYVVTVLVPIAIPSGEGERRGDLIIYPKLRRIRANILANVLEKAFLQNRLARRLARSRSVQHLLGAKLVRMVPGDMYFFWGYQSLHGNEPCYATSVRSTALFHFADPHEQNILATLIQRVRLRHEQRIRERAIARAARRVS